MLTYCFSLLLLTPEIWANSTVSELGTMTLETFLYMFPGGDTQEQEVEFLDLKFTCIQCETINRLYNSTSSI